MRENARRDRDKESLREEAVRDRDKDRDRNEESEYERGNIRRHRDEQEAKIERI